MSANIKAVWMTGVFFVAACAAAGRASAVNVEAASSASTAALAVPVSHRLEEFHMVSVSLADGLATLRGPDNQMVSLKVGSTLVSAKARLVEVQSDRLRFDAIDDKGRPQTAWMIRSQTPGHLPEVKRTARK